MKYVDTDYVTSFGRTIRNTELANMIERTILNFRKVSGRAPRIVFIPLLHMSGSQGGCNHWTMLVIDLEKREYVYYDSLKRSTEHIPKIISDQIAILETRLTAQKIGKSTGTFRKIIKNTPIQSSTWECGYFALGWAHQHARRIEANPPNENAIRNDLFKNAQRYSDRINKKMEEIAEENIRRIARNSSSECNLILINQLNLIYLTSNAIFNSINIKVLNIIII